MTKEIRLNAFHMNAPGHSWPGLWSHPSDQSAFYNEIDYWIDIARTGERGKFDAVFLADALGVYDVFRGTPDAALASGAQIPLNDPLLLVPAMAYATRDIGFAVTSNVSYENPYLLARRFSTLDHITRGRIGWNIVTGYLESGAKAMGHGELRRHDDRYDVAHEYMELVYKLWEGSWEDDAVVRDKAAGLFTRPEKVHRVRHEGKHFHVDAIHLSEPSLQRTPVLYQAGTSTKGREFAAKHAECIFMNGNDKTLVAAKVADIRRQARDHGRDPAEVLIFLGATVIVGATDAEARDKYEDYSRHADQNGTFALMSGWSGIDFSKYSPDDPVRYVESNSIQSMVETLTVKNPGKVWTVGDLANFGPVGSRGPFIVGSPQSVADELVAWVAEVGVDGFNLNRVIAPKSLEDFVDLVVPELQSRGVYKTEYRGGTFREKLYGAGRARLSQSHPGAAYRIRRPEETLFLGRP
jgi:FMN-dependent oxidoreductase (nitrilotriacetate monooxygenase family)